jgi:hypothetical protein
MGKVQDFLNLNQRIIDFVDKNVKTKVTKSQPGFKQIAIFLFAKSTKTARAIQLLCSKGFGQDAAILTRSLLENLITLSYIGKQDTDKRAKLFAGHFTVDYRKYLEKHNELLSDKRYLQIDSNVKKRHDEIYDETIRLKKVECNRIKDTGCYGINQNSWSCLSLSGMAKETNLVVYYDRVYWLVSQFSHPHLASSAGYVVENGDGSFIINDMPSEVFIQETLVIVMNVHLMIIKMFNDIFQLGLGQTIGSFFKDYTDLVGNS